MERERLGRYELVAHLASGGMGRVCVARVGGEGGFERHVLIKSLDLVGTDDEEAQAMFLDEARILGMLHHQHVASIQEVARDDDGVLFLVLEFVHGHTAHDIWERALDLEVQLPLDFTLTIVAAAASGLHYAHTKRSPDGERLHIVHRDVTLSNLMVGFDGAIKVIDFGIAKAAARSTRTQAGYVKGKLGYMAPEQLRGQAVDGRTDVFALGIVLYELTTMRRAFREESDRATIDRIKAGKYTRPSELVHDYPPELEAIVVRALQLDPAKRYPDMDAMRRELEALGHRHHLVLGDAAVVEVMAQLFENRAEPWQRRATTRAESEISIEAEWDDPHGAVTRHAEVPSLRPAEPPPARAPVSSTRDTVPVATLASAAEPPAGAKKKSIAEVDPSSSGAAMALSMTGAPRTRAPKTAESGADLPALRGVTNSSGEVVAVGTTPRTLTNRSGELAALRPGRPRAPSKEQVKKTAHIRVPDEAPPRSSLAMWLAVAAAAFAVAAVVAVILMREDSTASADSQRQQAAPDAPAPAPKSPDPAPEKKPDPAPQVAPEKGSGSGSAAAQKPGTVHLKITSTPSDATVLLDNRRLGHTPWEADVPIDTTGTKHQLKIRRRGYIVQLRDIRLDADVAEDFTMIRAAATPEDPQGSAADR
ncbi:MAG: serine/threonine protein kinase [Deltaproteobacteria bacterium]|nr:serine/threonine protein kinase [Deltaproteobacteria bacterium]